MALLQACLGFGAAGALLAIALRPGLWDASGFPEPAMCLALAAVLALVLYAAALRSQLRNSAAWLGVTIVGQAATLQLIDAGPSIHYQHYRVGAGALDRVELASLVLVLLQAALVGAALWPRRAAIGGWLREQLGTGGMLGIAAVFVGTAAFPSRDLAAFGVELAFAVFVRSVALGSLVALLLSVPDAMREACRQRLGQLLGPADAVASDWRSERALVLGCAGFVALTAALINVGSYDRHPHVPDEIAYLMHARYFAEGALGTPVPPVPEAFDVYLWPCDEQRCFSPVPPGWPAALALGVRLGAPWLVNPLLGALAILLAHRLLSLLYDPRTARLGVLMLAASPWYLLVSMSFMTHAWSLCCALLAAICVAYLERSPRGPRPAVALLGGAAIGLVSLTRPLEGVIVAGVLGAAALALRGRRFRLAPVALLALGSLAVGALVLPYNRAMTGDPLRFPIMAYADAELGPGVNALGFGPERGTHWGGLDPFPGHGLPDVLVNSALNLTAIDVELFGWAFGSTLPLLLLLVLRRLRRNDLWLLAFVASLVAWHSLYWYSGGPDFGARYWYLAIVPLVGLSARGVLELSGCFERSAAGAGSGALVVAGALLACALSLVAFVPWRAVDKYHHYRGMRADLRELLASGDFDRGLLLVRGERHPDYASAFVYTSLDPAGREPVIAWDRDADLREALLRAYPERRVWRLDGPSITGAGYRVRAGPSEPGGPSSNAGGRLLK